MVPSIFIHVLQLQLKKINLLPHWPLSFDRVENRSPLLELSLLQVTMVRFNCLLEHRNQITQNNYSVERDITFRLHC